MLETKALHENSFVVISNRKTSPVPLNSPDKRDEITEKIFSKNEWYTELKANFTVTPTKSVEVSLSHLKSTFRRASNYNQTAAIELYRFINFPISVVLFVQQNNEKTADEYFVQEILPLIARQDAAELELNIPKNVYDTIQHTCLKRDGLLREEANAQLRYRVGFHQRALGTAYGDAITVSKPFSIIVSNTLDNIVLSRAEICDPSKNDDKLKKMLKSSTPTVQISKWQLFKSKAKKSFGSFFWARRRYSFEKTTCEFEYDDRKAEMGVINQLSLSETGDTSTYTNVYQAVEPTKIVINSDNEENEDSKSVVVNSTSCLEDSTTTEKPIDMKPLSKQEQASLISLLSSGSESLELSTTSSVYYEDFDDSDSISFDSNQSYLDSLSETSEWYESHMTEIDADYSDTDSSEDTVISDSCSNNSVMMAPLTWKAFSEKLQTNQSLFHSEKFRLINQTKQFRSSASKSNRETENGAMPRKKENKSSTDELVSMFDEMQ